MKKLFNLLIISTILLMSCNEQKINSEKQEEPLLLEKKPEINIRIESEKLTNILKKYEDPSQIHRVSSSKPSEIKGKKGTIIQINPSDYITEGGKPLGRVIEVELKELTNQYDLLKSNAPTVSNGELLVSGGAYFINLTSNGEQLKLKEGKEIKVQFPVLSEDEMLLFYGTRDSIEQLNWQETSKKLEIPKQQPIESAATPTAEFLGSYEPTYETAKKKVKKLEEHQNNRILSSKIYKELSISKLGWINVDRFLKILNKSELIVEFEQSDSINFANIYIVFEDINSLIQSFYIADYNPEKKFFIPSGSKIRIISYSAKDDKVMASFMDTIIKENQKITLPMKPVNEQDLGKLFKKK